MQRHLSKVKKRMVCFCAGVFVLDFGWDGMIDGRLMCETPIKALLNGIGGREKTCCNMLERNSNF